MKHLTSLESRDDEIVPILREILRWLRFDGMQRAKTVLTSSLEKEAEKVVYQSSDGRSSLDIGKVAGVSHQTVVNYWKKWSRLGIVEPLKAPGGTRFKRVFSLEDYGIEVPTVRNPADPEMVQKGEKVPVHDVGGDS